MSLTKTSTNIIVVNTFVVNIPILCPMKTPENQSFSGIFRVGFLVFSGGKNGNICQKWVRFNLGMR